MAIAEPTAVHSYQLTVINLMDALRRFQADGVDPRSLMSEDEQARLRTFAMESSSIKWSLSRAALRTELAKQLACPPLEVQFEVGVNGKPGIKGLAGHPFHFNYSHSGDLALLVTSRAHEVGVDLEQVRPIKRLTEKCRLFLAECEQREIDALPESDRSTHFLKLWVFKEAIAKALGGGLQNRTRNIRVSARPTARVYEIDLPIDPECQCANAWSIQELHLADYIGAIAFCRASQIR